VSGSKNFGAGVMVTLIARRCVCGCVCTGEAWGWSVMPTLTGDCRGRVVAAGLVHMLCCIHDWSIQSEGIRF
jgi:hypothetical protein